MLLLTGTVPVVVVAPSLGEVMLLCVLLVTESVPVAPSLGGLPVGCLLLLTGTVPVAPSLGGVMLGCVLLLAESVPVAPSLGRLPVGCVLLLTGAVPVVVIVPLLWIGEDTPTVWEVVGIDAVERKYTRWHFTWTETQDTKHRNMKVISSL